CLTVANYYYFIQCAFHGRQKSIHLPPAANSLFGGLVTYGSKYQYRIASGHNTVLSIVICYCADCSIFDSYRYAIERGSVGGGRYTSADFHSLRAGNLTHSK